MKLAKLLIEYCSMETQSKVIIVTDDWQADMAKEIASGLNENYHVQISKFDVSSWQLPQGLTTNDLLIVMLSLDTFITKQANRYFSPFRKPKGLLAKYVFMRLDIPRQSLLEGLQTPITLVQGKVEELKQFSGCFLRVTNEAGTDLTLKTADFLTASYCIEKPGEMAFLPPSESSAEVIPSTAEGVIVIDASVGQLYYYGELLGTFGLVKEPIKLIVQKGVLTDIIGGEMADELKQKLFALNPECRILVELGHGLSQMQPIGLIGVDESCLGTCHFGFGDAGTSGVHLDLVIHKPQISLLNS